jgi:hypothetical protein
MFTKVTEFLKYTGSKSSPEDYVKGIVKVEFTKEVDYLKNQIMLYKDITQIPNVVANMIAEFAQSADESIIYVSISLDTTNLSHTTIQCVPDLLEALSRYATEKTKTYQIPTLLLQSRREVSDKLWPWQRSAVDRFLAIMAHPPLHTSPRDVVHQLPTLAYTHGGYVATGPWDPAQVPFPDTTSFAGSVLMGPRAVGKKRAALMAMMSLRDTTPTTRTHIGRLSHKTMVIVTTATNMAAWRTEVDEVIPGTWTVLYVHNETTLLHAVEDFASVDLVIVNRQAVASAASSLDIFRKRHLFFTMQWRAVIFDEAETLVSKLARKEDSVVLDRKTIILKTFFLGHYNIIITSDMDILRTNLVDTYLYLVGVTQNQYSATYPPPLNYLDVTTRGENVFGSQGGHRFPINESTKDHVLRDFLAHHVFLMVGHSVESSPPPITLLYDKVTGKLGSPHDMMNAIEFFLQSPNAKLQALCRAVVFVASQKDTKVLIYYHGSLESSILKQNLEEYALTTTWFPINRSALNRKRQRERVEKIKSNVIIIDDSHGQTTHFPSVTHIFTTGQGDANALFIERATRYGLMVDKPIVRYEIN